MADVGTLIQLATPGGTILFNNGQLRTLDDLYWVQEIEGLDGPPVRSVIDKKPLADGGLVHKGWKGHRKITFDGVIFIQSTPFGDACRQKRNTFENNLRVALESIIPVAGTLSWTPIGLASRSLTVQHAEEDLLFRHLDDYALLGFTFGLVAGNPNWV